MKAIRIFLFVLIVIGVTLLCTQRFWVPKLVNYIFERQGTSFEPVESTISTSTPVARPGKVDTGVEGIVTIGPTCPVMRIPPDPQCADKPYPTTLIIASTIIGKNGGVLVKTDSKGYFSKELEPGTYTIKAESNSQLPRLAPVTFTVLAHKLVSLNLQFDSGIR